MFSRQIQSEHFAKLWIFPPSMKRRTRRVKERERERGVCGLRTDVGRTGARQGAFSAGRRRRRRDGVEEEEGGERENQR